MFEKTTDFKDYFPDFIDEDAKKRETREVVEEIDKLFDVDQLFGVNMIQGLTRLVKQLNQFEDLTFVRFVKRSERVRIIQNIWNVIVEERATINTKIRFANILASHINSYKKLYLRPWWHGEFVSQIDLEEGRTSVAQGFKCRCEDDVLERQGRARDENCICGLIDIGYIINQIESEFAKDYLDGLSIGVQKTRNYISSLARVLNAFRPYVQEDELEDFITRWQSLTTKSFLFFVYSKLFALISSPYCSYRLLESGRIFEIWGFVNGQLVSQWDSLMMEVVSRGVRYSWRTGRSLDSLYKRVPYFFEILYINLGVPILHNVVSNSINTGATSSTSSVSSRTSSSQVLQTKVPSIAKEVVTNELLSALTIKPVNIFNKFAIVFVHMMKSLNSLQSTGTQDQQLVENVKVIPNSLINLVNIVYPLNHPSNIGKWSHGISVFVQALTYQFCKRIYRERVFIRSEKMSEREKELIGRASLCRFDDEYLMSILFPLMEQGIYSKDSQVASRYEDSLKRWTYILPDILLSFLLNVKIIPALEGDTEAHQVYIAFRMLATLVPLVIQFLPQELPKLLQISLQGIDISDPMKINQALLFLTVFFYNLQSFSVENLDFDEYETMKKLSVLLESEHWTRETATKTTSAAAIGLRNYYSLYNYPKSSIPLSDKSLRDRKDLPQAILDQTDVNGQSPLDLYFKLPSTEWGGGGFEFVMDEEARRDFYFVFCGKFDGETLRDKFEQRKVLLDSVFGYWVMECFDRILSLLGNVLKPSETGGFSSSVDLGISYALRTLVMSIFSKCKEFGYDQLLRDCYDMIGSWVCRNYIPDNYKHLSKILSAMGSCDPELSFGTVLSRLLLKMNVGSRYGKLASREALSHPDSAQSLPTRFTSGAGDLQSEDESFILYYASLVSSLVRYTRDHFLLRANRDYYFGIYSLIVELLLDSRRKVRRAGLKLEQRLIESLSHVQVVEPGDSRRAPLARSPEQIAKGIILWGLPFYLQEQSVFCQVQRPRWFVPERTCLLEVKSLVIFNYLFVLGILKSQVRVDSAEFSGLLDSLFRQYLSLFEATVESLGEDQERPRRDGVANFQVLLGTIIQGGQDEDGGSHCSQSGSDNASRRSGSGDLMGSIIFCLNSLRVLNKSISYVVPIARNEYSCPCPVFPRETGSGGGGGDGSSQTQEESTVAQDRRLLAQTLDPESFREFEPFFSRFYLDTHRLILSLVEVFLGVRMVQVVTQGQDDLERFSPDASAGNNGTCYYRLSDPLFKITSTEEIRFKSKVIKTINQCLNRYYSSSSSLSLSSLYNTDFSESVLAWLSYTNGLYYQSAMLSSPRIFWLKNIQYYWNKRINLRRHEYGFFGSRRKLIYLITLFSLGNYSLVRKAAQSALKDSVNSHFSSRRGVFQFILFEVYFAVFLFRRRNWLVAKSAFAGQEEEKKEGKKACGRGGWQFEQVLRSNVEYVRSAFEASFSSSSSSSSSSSADAVGRREDPAEEFLFNHLSGLSHIVVGNSMYHRFLWSNMSLLLHLVLIVSCSSSFKLSKESIPARLLSALSHVMISRDFGNLLYHHYLAGSSRRDHESRQEGFGDGILETKLSRLVGLFGGGRTIRTTTSPSAEEEQEKKPRRQEGLLEDELDIVSRIISVDDDLTDTGSAERTVNDVVRMAGVFIQDLNGMRSREQLSTSSHSLLRRSLVYLMFVHGVIVSLESSSLLEKSEESRSSYRDVVSEYWSYLWGVFLEMDRSNGGGFYYVVFFSLTSLAKQLSEKEPTLFAELVVMRRGGGELLDFTTSGDKIKSLLENVVSIRTYYHQISSEGRSSLGVAHGGGGVGGGGQAASRLDRRVMNSSNTSAVTNFLVQNYTHIANSFPHHRFKCYSSNLSLVSVLFFQRVLSMLRMRRPESEEAVEAVLDALWDWSSSSVISLEKERHFLLLEVLASVFSASTTSSEMETFLSDQRVVSREKLVRLLRHEFQQSDQDFIFNFMDFIKYSITPLARRDLHCQRGGLPGTDSSALRKLLLDFVSNPFGGDSERGRSGVETALLGENDLSTLEMIKYLRIYQSALVELTMNDNWDGVSCSSRDRRSLLGASPEQWDFLINGLRLFHLTIQKENYYKQLREEMSNLLHSLVVAGSYLPCASESDDPQRESLVGAYSSIVSGLLEDLDAHLLASRSGSDDASREGVVTKDEDLHVVSKAETILHYCLLRGLHSGSGRSSPGLSVEEVVPFDGLLGVIGRLQLISAGNDDLLGLSYGSLMSLLVTQLNSADVPVMARLDHIVNGQRGQEERELGLNGHKSRLLRIRVNTIVGEFYSPLLSGTQLQLDAVNKIIVHGLFEEQSSEVRHISKLALCSLFRALPSPECLAYVRLFRLWIGRSAVKTSAAAELAEREEARLTEQVGMDTSETALCSSSRGDVSVRTNERFHRAGVLGLVSAVLSHPFDVPFWLPETITFLASSSGGQDVPHVLKKQVQECIQEFFKTHQDGWNFIHKYKFSSRQLEALDTYKGRPAYFT